MEQPNNSLIAKYNVAAPRYTSYPTVPFWESDVFNPKEWLSRLKTTYAQSKSDGISLYVHLPFCERLCTYCGCNTRITKNHGVETPYINYVLREWEMYKAAIDEEIVISEIHLGGGTPTFFEPVNLQRLIVGLLNGATVKEGASFSFEAHPANTTKEHLHTLYRLGFRRLSLGIQDFDPHVQYLINRHQTVEDVQRVMDEAREIGYTSINFDLIYGLPLQTQTTVRDTIKKSLRMSPDRISFYSYAHVPWIKPGQRRFTEHDLPVGEEKLALYILGKQMIEEKGYKDVGMDHFAKPEDELFKAALSGSLHRNFMGYADRYTPVLIGLGVSSISDAWSSFAQNVKKVEDYYRLLDEERLPVVKGHLLHEEDKVLRRYILEMMCKGKVELKDGFSLNEVIVDRLHPLERDGLVACGTGYIKATQIGRSFLRNICMAFDQRLQLSKEQEQLFSQAI
ncbi:oxygen-independent coproporphyrinogen III oxidase [Sphingobacterium phlebotomi]|uniref:Coproporphyrinogen-III oxidase n=1 Tax=Sphingobacterium phlebotomi TaxID=2605433 RepID=A0A5D4H7T4_9SPHI|nr:oxygen-independent coproporphyrinogen III oxidase [Sphingobacterium phlebotomi]TYR35505.1 oxygen-independent coproporphyrinogen III oxidase [Sphingobacterium phlebotomi]